MNVRKILLPTDLSPCAARAIPFAADLARSLGASLTALGVVDPLPPIGPYETRIQELRELQEAVAHETRDALQKLIHAEIPEGIETEVRLSSGSPADEIVRVAGEGPFDLIVLATPWPDRVLPPVDGERGRAGHPARALPRGGGPGPRGGGVMASPPYGRILFATDLSPCSEAAWEHAVHLARVGGASILLHHVVHVPEAAGLYEAYVFDSRELQRQAVKAAEIEVRKFLEAHPAEGVEVETSVRVGVPHDDIVRIAKSQPVDLVVLGTHGRGGLSRFLLGSVAERVVRTSPCPVLTVPPGEESGTSASEEAS